MMAEETEALRAAIARVAEPPGDGLRQATRVRLRRHPGRLPLSLRLVATNQLGMDAAGSRSVAIFIGEPDGRQAIDRGTIAETFRLAPREVEIATLLAAGLSVVEIASQTGLREGSVRTYLKRIFFKTDARSQAALVALLRGFV